MYNTRARFRLEVICGAWFALRRQNDFGMKQRSGYAGGDGDQVGLASEDLNQPGAGEIRQVDGLAAADAGGVFFIRSRRWEFRQQFPRMKTNFVGAFLRIAFSSSSIV